MKTETAKYLIEQYEYYNTNSFVALDPISIPHEFSKLQDIEISGLFAAILAWGNRKSIINSCHKLLTIMDFAPYDFIINHSDQDLKNCENFVHRTFNSTDLLYFIAFLKHHYSSHNSLESAFLMHNDPLQNTTQNLIAFKEYFFSLPYAPLRTKKHIASPITNATCKRINMFLRWMVRPKGPIDFGIWENLHPSQLICPIDVHVARVARHLGILKHPKDDWKAAVALTNNLKKLDSTDPVKFDIALFGIGASGII